MSAQFPIFIICRDRLACLERLVGELRAFGQDRITLVDNASTYPPLLDYYARNPHRVKIERLSKNLGPKAPWITGALDVLQVGEPYVVTDPDVIPAPECPDDFLEFLAETLKRYPVDKVGPSLRITDLPDCYAHKRRAIAWEEQFYRKKILPHDWMVPQLYYAPIDTTFALYRHETGYNCHAPAIRVGAPVEFIHLPWYVDSARPTEETGYYEVHATPDVVSWGSKLPAWLEEETRP